MAGDRSHLLTREREEVCQHDSLPVLGAPCVHDRERLAQPADRSPAVTAAVVAFLQRWGARTICWMR